MLKAKNCDQLSELEDDIEKMFKETDDSFEGNKIGYKNTNRNTSFLGSSRNYYPRPTTQDILYEENIFSNQQSFSGSYIYYWNIVGMKEYQIIGLMNRIMMYATVYKAKGNNERSVALFIISGFLGSLKCDNFLTSNQRAEVLNVVKDEHNEAGQIIEQSDMIYTLIHAILLQFVGTVNGNTESQRYILQNFKCLSLAHFRWGKDVFIAKVMSTNQKNKKEEFLDLSLIISL